jgi:hypothetical protein
MSKKISNAFSLIEALLYVSLTLSFSFIIFSVFLKGQKDLLFDSLLQRKLIRESVALDLMRRDLLCSSANTNDWNCKEFIFCKNGIDKSGLPTESWIRWSAGEKGLSRTEGIYDNLSHKWIKRYTRGFGSNINFLELSFNLDIDKNRTRGVCVEYSRKNENKKYQIFISLRNRII